jgi:hypothetical protein
MNKVKLREWHFGTEGWVQGTEIEVQAKKLKFLLLRSE